MAKLKKAVVTGANGLVGKALVRHLVATGVDTVAVDHQATMNHDCQFVLADLRQSSALETLLHKDTCIFHMAARASVAISVQDPVGDFHNNVAAFLEVLESARRADCQVIFPSSSAVFNSDEPLPHTERAYTKPTSPYGAAKLACEGYCAAYHRCFDLNVKIARMFNVYGPEMNRFAIFDFIKKIKANPNEIEILGDGNQMRDYLYIDDTVEGLVTIAESGVAGEDYNLASGVPITSVELASAVAKEMGHPNVSIKTRGMSFPGDIPKWYADISKLKSIGFRPKVVLEKGLKKTVRALVDQIQ